MKQINTCLIIDTETNGNQDHQTVLEVGAILYSVKHQTMLSCGSSLMTVSNDILNLAELINRIPVEAAKEPNPQQQFFEQWILSAYHESDALIAHNKEFDQPLVLALPWAANWDKPWLCTYQDFALFPDAYPGRRDLISLAQFYGIGISISHRAINDCLLLAEVFNRVPNLAEQFQIAQLPLIEAIVPKSDESLKLKGFRWDYTQQGWFKKDLGQFFDFPTIKATEPRYLFRASVSYDDRQIAKNWGFIWNAKSKVWERRISPEAIDFLPFPVVQMEVETVTASGMNGILA